MQKALAIALSAVLSLTACAPAGSVTGDISDDATPLAPSTEEPVSDGAGEPTPGADEPAADEVALADSGESQDAAEQPEATYSQTLDDGTVVSSEDLDVTEMDIEVVKTEEEAPETTELPSEVLDPETTDGSQYSTFELEEAMGAAMNLSAAPAATPLATSSTVGGLTITGGTVGSDFTHSANEVVIKTSTPLTLKGTFTGTIKVQAGTEAWIILNGVSVTANSTSSPINLITPSKAHIILADGSSNTLHTNQQLCAGIHCGDGSELWIDDALVNYDFNAKKHIDVLYGVVDTAGTVTNLSTGEQHEVAQGDVLSKINSSGKVGRLTVHGGKGSAGIGAGPAEVAGTMVFDGGYIESFSWGGHSNNYGSDSTAMGVGTTKADGKNEANSSGTGIGGGSNGGGATQTTFNAGTIYAYGSYHGAGIGAGWSSGPTNLQTGAKAPTRNKNNCGNININGGYILSQGYAHGNAFGGACGTTLTGNTVRITGGTLRPFSKSNKMDIGGAGGYVVIDGGSVSLSGGPSSQASNFQSSDNKAYSDTARTQEVVPVEVDLAAETGNVDYNITSWTLYIDGVQQSYGAPSTFNGGKLCLWLPPEAKTKKVTVELNYYNEEKGAEVLVEPLYRDAGSQASTVKRNVYFDMPTEIFGDVEKETVELPPITNFPNELLVDGKVPESVNIIKKVYDGLPFETASVAGLEITESRSGEVRQLKEDQYVKYTFRSLNGNTLSDELTSDTMPSDTGLMAFAMNSTEYANYVDPVTKEKWGNSYIGHRSNGWCQITPVPAVLTLESAEWGNLDLATGAWKATTSEDDEPGNRIKVTMNVRSAIGTMPTCKTPSGEVQLTIDGREFGDPIELTEEYIVGDGTDDRKWNSYSVTEGAKTREENTEEAINSAENRWTAHVVYYMDPAQADGLLNPRSSVKPVAREGSGASVFAVLLDGIMRLTAGDEAYADGDIDESRLGENEYKLSAVYTPDKNYIEGVEANPQNADATATIIVPVDTPISITDDQGDTYDFEPTDPDGSSDDNPDGGPGTNPGISPGTNPGTNPGDTPAPGSKTGSKTLRASTTKNYSDFHKVVNGQETISKDYFTLNIDSDSAMPMEWTTSDPAVADVMRDEKGNVLYDENGDPRIQVNSCGTVTLTMHQDGNAIYNEQTRVIELTVIPDSSLKPETEVRVVWENKTHPGLPAAPGDEIEYTVVGSNFTDGSSWQNVQLGDILSDNVTLVKDSVQVAKNFTTPEDLEAMTAKDLADLPFAKDGTAKISTTADGKVTVQTGVNSIYGGQSSAMKFTATVNAGLTDRSSVTGDNPPTIPNEPTFEGTYGVKETKDLVPGEEAGSGTPQPVTDTAVYGIEDTAEPDAGVIPRDPSVGGKDSEIYVNKTAKNLTRDGVVTLPGDVIRYQITVGNRAADTCLYWPVIRDTLPVGLVPVPGSFVLTRVDGSEVSVGDGVFAPQTHTVALYVDDLYGEESTTLTFECTVGEEASDAANTAQVMGTSPSEKYKEDHPEKDDGEDPRNDEDPDDVNPDGGTTPDGTDPHGTDPQGTDPQDGGEDLHGNDPADDKGPEENAPDKVTPPWPPVPGQAWTPNPDTSSEDYPWGDFDWDKYIEEKGIPEVQNEEPATPGTVIPANDPKVFSDDNGPADLTIVKTAENLTNNDDETYVGDRVRYAITVADGRPGTAWFNAIVRDDLPRGVEIDLSTVKLVTAQGVEVVVAADAYSSVTRVLAVNVGDVPGGKAATLTFEADITEAALGGDIGNLASAYGTLPSQINPEDLAGDKRPSPGSGFTPEEGWTAYDEGHRPIVTPEAAYPSKHAKDGVRPAFESPKPNKAKGAEDDGWGTNVVQGYLKLAQTGDPLALSLTTLFVLAIGAAATLVIAHRRKDEDEASEV